MVYFTHLYRYGIIKGYRKYSNKDTNIMRKIISHPDLMIKTFREGKYPDFGCEYGRTCVYTRYAPAVVMGSQTVAS